MNLFALGLPLYLALARALELPEDDFERALEKHVFYLKIREDFIGGARSGVNGTPTFFINGRRHDGSYDFDDLVTAIDHELADVKAAN